METEVTKRIRHIAERIARLSRRLELDDMDAERRVTLWVDICNEAVRIGHLAQVGGTKE